MNNAESQILRKMSIKAVLRGDLTTIKELISDGVDINTTDNKGQTLLMLSILSGSPGIAEFLIKAGVDVNKYGEYQLSPLHILSTDSFVQDAKWRQITRLIVASGADINALDKWHETALNRAVWHNKLKIVLFFLKLGADPNIPDNYGVYPLHYAATHKNTNMMRALIKSGADFNVKDSKNITPLGYLKLTNIDDYIKHEKDLISLVKFIQNERLRKEDNICIIRTDYEFDI